MKIAWATPFSRSSAIGRVSADVTAALAAGGHEVRIILTELKEPGPRTKSELHDTDLPWAMIADVDPHELAREVDLVVIQVGDHFLNHAGIFRLLEARDAGMALPILGVFHDFYLCNLFNGWLHFGQHRGRSPDRAWEIEAVYGPEARGADASGLTLEQSARQIPMTEWVAARCDAALAHAQFYKDRLDAACPGPVSMARLPVTPRGVEPLPPRPAAIRLNALTVGVANPNKAAESVIAAIAGSPKLRERLDYRLTGPIELDRRNTLEAFASSLGYSGLRIDGAVDDATLARRLTEADIVVCLRKPVLEGASGSIIEALLSGRPVIVAEAGFYAELPDDVVLKIPADINGMALTAALERLFASEDLRQRLGSRARKFAEETFTVEAYLKVLEPLMMEALASFPALQMSRSFGRRLSAFGISPKDPSVERIGAHLQAVFGG